MSVLADPVAWPALPLAEWHDTYDTLHRMVQIIGKTRMALSPIVNHYWHVTQYVTPRGLTTSPIPCGTRTFEVDLDFIDHLLLVRTSDGITRTMPLIPRTIADFYDQYMALLDAAGVRVHIWPVPSEMADTLRFTDDRVHASYDADAANRCWRILAQTDRVIKQFRGRFIGKCSPSHFWWGGFDLSCTRFSGRRAPMHPGGIPNIPDYVNREAYSHECISAGWWPGIPGSPVADAAFYAYAYPEPPGCPTAAIGPATASYNLDMHEWILPYEAVRTSADPDGELLTFLQSTYDAAATLGGWDRAALERAPTSLPR